MKTSRFKALAKSGKAISSQGDGQDHSYAGWRVGTSGLSCISVSARPAIAIRPSIRATTHWLQIGYSD